MSPKKILSLQSMMSVQLMSTCSWKKRRLMVFLLLLVVSFPTIAAAGSAFSRPQTQHLLDRRYQDHKPSLWTRFKKDPIVLQQPSPTNTALLRLRGGGVGGIVLTILRTAMKNPVLILRKSTNHAGYYIHEMSHSLYTCSLVLPIFSKCMPYSPRGRHGL